MWHDILMFWIAAGAIGIITLPIAIHLGKASQIAPLWKNYVEEGYGAYLNGVGYFRWYTSSDINDMPTMSITFDTFMTIYQAAPRRIVLLQEREFSIDPGPILYDYDGDGKTDVRILMSSKKDANACWNWLYDLLRERSEHESERKEVQDSLALLKSAQRMHTDIKSSVAAHHDETIAAVERNRRWRVDAIKRQNQMRGGH